MKLKQLLKQKSLVKLFKYLQLFWLYVFSLLVVQDKLCVKAKCNIISKDKKACLDDLWF